jgi:hypothetical protein
MTSSSLKKAGAVTSGQLKQNLNPRSPKLRSEKRLDVDSSELMRQYEPQRALLLPGEKTVISPTELIVESVGETSLVPAAETDSVFARLGEAQRALAEATSIQEVKQIADLTQAARVYLQRSKASVETIYAATSLRIRAKRRLGEMLIEARESGKLRTSDDGRSKGVDNHDTLTLPDLDLTRDESSRAQRLAAIPSEEFEKRLLACHEGGRLSLYHKSRLLISKHL